MSARWSWRLDPRRVVDTALVDAWARWAARRDRWGPRVRVARAHGRRLERAERSRRRAVAADPRHLHRFEARRFSQQGEDGLLAEVLRRVGAPSRFAVEVGAADGAENCTRALVEDGWSAVWVEGDPGRAAAARVVAGGRPVEVVEAFVDAGNVVALLDATGAPDEPDLLVIDVDGNDWWIWRTLARRLRARVVLIEYNPVVGRRAWWVLPHDPSHRWDETARHGAGLGALEALGRTLGYRLVGCDSNGVNACFVRADLVGDLDPGDARRHWVAPGHRLPFGHPWAPELSTPPTAPVPLEHAPSIRLALDRAPRARAVEPGQPVHVVVTVADGAPVPIGSTLPYPVRLAWWWARGGGEPRPAEPARAPQSWWAEPGDVRALVCRAVAPDEPGPWTLVLALVQESVRWMDAPGSSGRLEVPGWHVGVPGVASTLDVLQGDRRPPGGRRGWPPGRWP
jgi:hypothetical protein